MALLTEEDVRRMSNQGTRGPVVVNRDQMLTPGARDYLREHRVEVVYPQGEAAGEGAPSAPAKYRTLFGAALNEKPEHMTHLKGNVLVFKDHPRIAFRGWIDALEAEILLTQQAAAGRAMGPWPGSWRRFWALSGAISASTCWTSRWGPSSCAAIRRSSSGSTPTIRRSTSASPTFWPAIPTAPPCWRSTSCALWCGRPSWPPTPAFRDADGNVTRGDMILGLNRLSSLMWIFMIKLKAGRYERK